MFNLFNSSKNFYDQDSREIYFAILEEINKIIKKNNKIFIIGYMDTTTKLNKELIRSINKRKIDIIDLTLDKKNDEYWLPDKHTSKLGNEKRVLQIQKFLKQNLYLN